LPVIFSSIGSDSFKASTIKKETGAKKPSGMALKLLAVVQKHGLKMLA